MPKKKIKRPVVSLDTSNQLGLFAQESLPETKERAQSNTKAVKFNAPDPRSIQLNGVRLDEYLQHSGEKAALKVRELLQTQSWEVFESAYSAKGRSPYAPQAMVGLILYGLLKGVSSLRDLERFARVDLGCLWVSGGILPDHSIIGRFIQRHEAYLSEEFFVSLTKRVVKVTGSDTSTVSGDGTVIEAAASRYRVVKEEALKQLKAQAQEALSGQEKDKKGEKRLAQLEEAQRRLQARKAAKKAVGKNADTMQISPVDPEAVIQPLKDKKRFAPSYKPSVLANSMRVILAQDVDASSETRVVSGMLKQAKRQGEIKQALFDAGYHSKQVLEASEEHEIDLLCPEGQSQGESWNKRSEKRYPKSQFKYDAQRDSYRCPQGEELSRHSEYKGNEKYCGYIMYSSSACAQCEQRSRCTKSPQGRRIKRYEEDEAKDRLRQKMEKPENRQSYRKRQGMVEPVFSQLKCRQGLSRFRRKGLKAVRCEFALHAMAYNLSRAVALWAPTIIFIINSLLSNCINDGWQALSVLKEKIFKPIPKVLQSFAV
jgi:transposase